MEVHHPQLEHHKKKWTGYLLEFFMLFLAIFLGFIAENIREGIHNKEMEKAYLKSIIKDLEADSVRTDLVINFAESGEKGILSLSHFLFQYHTGKIPEKEFYEKIIPYSDSAYTYFTIFINNASYKNMLSSGRLNNMHNTALREKMAEYYESLSKRIDVNNAIVERDAEDYYNNSFPLVVPRFNRKSGQGMLGNLPGQTMHDAIKDSLFVNSRAFLEFYVQLPQIKSKLTGDDLIRQTENLYFRIHSYHSLCEAFKKANNELLEGTRNYLNK